MHVPDPSASVDSTLRPDARRNRQKLLLAARQAMIEHGADVPLEEIARRAEVGIATLYRRFPTRGALVRQVVIDTKLELLAEARRAVAARATGWEALSQFLRTVVTRRLGALLPVLGGQVEIDAEFCRVRDELVAAMERLISDSQAEGMLRGDVGFGDIQILITSLSRNLPRVAGPAGDAVTGRYIEIVLAGLRARDDIPALPDGPLTHADLELHFLRNDIPT